MGPKQQARGAVRATGSHTPTGAPPAATGQPTHASQPSQNSSTLPRQRTTTRSLSNVPTPSTAANHIRLPLSEQAYQLHVAAHPVTSHRIRTHYCIAAVSAFKQSACETDGYSINPVDAAMHALLFGLRTALAWANEDRNNGIALRQPTLVCHHHEILPLLSERLDDSVNPATKTETHRQVLVILRNNPHVRLVWVPEQLNDCAILNAKAIALHQAPPNLRPRSIEEASDESIGPNDLYEAATGQRRPTWRSLPSHLRELWVTLLSSLALDSKRSHLLRAALIIVAPVVFLDKRDAPTIEDLHRHLQRLVADRANVAAAVTRFVTRDRPAEQSTTPGEFPIKKIEHLISLGAERKAAAQLSAAEVVTPVTHAAAEAIRALFPPRVRDESPLQQFEDRVDAKSLYTSSVLKFSLQLSRGAAPGFDGWTHGDSQAKGGDLCRGALHHRDHQFLVNGEIDAAMRVSSTPVCSSPLRKRTASFAQSSRATSSQARLEDRFVKCSNHELASPSAALGEKSVRKGDL